MARNFDFNTLDIFFFFFLPPQERKQWILRCMEMEIVISEEIIKDSKSSFPEIVSLFFWRRRREAATIKVKENLTLGTRNSQRSDRSKSAYPSAPPWILVSEYKKTIEPEGSQRGEDKRWMTEIVSHAFHFSYSSNRIIVSFFFFFFSSNSTLNRKNR